ncbi:hypothetical protein CKM354_001025100 [Cercospora kikuchii]|uniref:Uncharacterized protein n=1 Tax=Cercospora kikuchii TaxID=84275 RepID=A0A9P3CT81_9PEZI|nr:uncharacterized protein CKM354_001025100 [Cercospora kikuchii]GIZ47152.1 hypothetical protein CKM354_001025100 [Cercospora kikuchii]
MYYDHRLGLLAISLLALPFALTFLLIALIGLASACLLLGHIGALLSQILQLVLPIPVLTTYLTALASPYSLLIATTLAGGLAGMWMYFSVQYHDLLAQYRHLGLSVRFPKNPFARIAGYMRKEIVQELQSPGNNNEDIDVDIAVDDRTVIHSPSSGNQNPTTTAQEATENTNPQLSSSNPFIRRISPLRNTDYDSFSQLHSTTPRPRLRPTANSFEFSPKMQYRSQQQGQKGLRPTANVSEFTPKRQVSTPTCVSEWDEGSGRWVWQGQRRQQEQEGGFGGGERYDGFVREVGNGDREFDEDGGNGVGIAGRRGFKAHFS